MIVLSEIVGWLKAFRPPVDLSKRREMTRLIMGILAEPRSY